MHKRQRGLTSSLAPLGVHRAARSDGGQRLHCAADGERELALRSYEHFASRDPLTDLVLERILAGTSCRGYERCNEPVGEEVEAEASATSRSAISRAFVEHTRSSAS